MAGNFAVDHNIGHSVATQSVGAMNAACDFAGGEKAGNGRKGRKEAAVLANEVCFSFLNCDQAV